MGFRNYKTVLYRDEDGQWIAEVPALGNAAFAQMPTREEALADVARACEMIAEEYAEEDVPLPEDTTHVRVFTRKLNGVSYEYKAILYSNESMSGWCADIPPIPGCNAYGDSPAEAWDRLPEVFAKHVVDYQRWGKSPPPDTTEIVRDS